MSNMIISEHDHDIIIDYIVSFVDMTSDLYHRDLEDCYEKNIGVPKRVLWDAIQDFTVCTMYFCKETLREHFPVIAFSDPFMMKESDVFSLIRIPDFSALEKYINTIGENDDMYFFDESYKWTFVITHEWNDKNRRYCICKKNASINKAI